MRIGLLAIAAAACGPGPARTNGGLVQEVVPGAADTFHISDHWFDASRLDCGRPTGDGVTLRVYGIAPSESAQVDFVFPEPPADGSRWTPGRDGFSVSGLLTDRVLYQDHVWEPDEGVVTVERTRDGLVLRWGDLALGGEGRSDGYVTCGAAEPDPDDDSAGPMQRID